MVILKLELNIWKCKIKFKNLLGNLPNQRFYKYKNNKKCTRRLK